MLYPRKPEHAADVFAPPDDSSSRHAGWQGWNLFIPKRHLFSYLRQRVFDRAIMLQHGKSGGASEIRFELDHPLARFSYAAVCFC